MRQLVDERLGAAEPDDVEEIKVRVKDSMENHTTWLAPLHFVLRLSCLWITNVLLDALWPHGFQKHIMSLSTSNVHACLGRMHAFIYSFLQLDENGMLFSGQPNSSTSPSHHVAYR